MADKSQERDAAHAMFGLNDKEARRPAEPEPEGTQPSAPPPSTAGTPQYIYVQTPPGSVPSPAPAVASASTPAWLIGLVVLLVILTGVNLYLAITSRQQFNDALSKQSDGLNLLSRRMNVSDERYAQLSGKFQVTTERLGLTQQELTRARALATNIEQQQQEAVQQLNKAIAQKASAEELNKAEADANAKIGGLSGDLAGTKADLAATKDALTGAKGELTGAIARTHDELVSLAHRTDRDYFEFNISTKKGRQKFGSVAVELLKTNPKKNLFTINLYFDDKFTLNKDKSIDQPILFYPQGASSSLELVVNKLGKDSIGGYLSAPKGFLANTPNVLTARPGA